MLKRFRSDRRGAAAVEFALTAPLLVLMYCGLAELSLAFLAERRAAHAAAVVADLVAQPATLTANQVDDIFKVTGPLMRPFPSSGISLRVSNVKPDSQGTPRVVWSRGQGMAALAANDPAPQVQAGLLASGQALIVTELSYTYASPIGHILPDGLSFEETARAWPRRKDVTLR